MPLIGVTPNRDENTGRLTIHEDYLNALLRAGALPVLLPMETDHEKLKKLLSALDGLLLSGGEDVEPARYGEKREPFCGSAAWARDEMEFFLCREAVSRDLPLLAICRGIQVLNAALGGTLYQDVAIQFGNALSHPRSDAPRDPVHEMRILPATRLSEILGTPVIGVNSRHHQSVKSPAPGLTVSAQAPDGLTEAVEMPGKKFVIGVQWHPESMAAKHPEAQRIFNAFISACTQK